MTKLLLLVVGLLLLLVGLFLGSSMGDRSDQMMSEIEGARTNVTTNSQMSVTANGEAIWQFPDKKALDPALFGTPQSPINVDLLPLSMRATNDDGTAYTTINKPLMFSNKIAKTNGSITLAVNDLTAKDTPNSKDTAEMEANFTGPNGEEYKVVLQKLIPVGPNHPFFGGVGTDVLMHGATGIGTPLVSEEFSYITLWGLADFYKDDQLVDTNRIIHVMVSERTRDDDFKVGFGVANPDELEIHLAMPPQKGSPNGPVDSPLKTGVILPNGAEQPFIHTNFYGNIKLEGNKFVTS